MIGLAKRVIRRMGYTIVPVEEVKPEFPPDFDDATQALCRLVRPFTMTSLERIFALRQAVLHVIHHKIPGSIVECGVWKGGSMMAVARTLRESGVTDRDLYLFDTFDGMPEPTTEDVTFWGHTAGDLMATSDKESSWVWAYAALDEVKRNLYSTGYPQARMSFVQGKVEDTIPQHVPGQIALLRLDTDWYESTRHELIHLYPRLSPGGVLIIDDYGHWAGSRKAVDEYVDQQGLQLMLQRVDYTGRICVKPN